MTQAPSFLGFRRPDGRVGVRNHVLVVPTVICASVVAERIAAAIAPVGAALPHLAGCGQLGPDMRVTHDTLAAYCQHPNVGAVLVVALGCEQVVAQHLADAARRARQAVEIVAIQSEGGTVRATERGVAHRAGAGRRARAAETREWCDASSLVLSLKCGGSDYTSGLASNPGARPRRRSPRRSRRQRRARRDRRDHGRRASAGRRARRRRTTAARLIRVITRVETEAMRARPRHSRHAAVAGQHPRRPDDDRGEVARRDAQGRRARAARGRRRLCGADHRRKGLTVMDTPGLDVESVTGMVGGGAQVVVFTTGLGTPTGNPIAPVIKITGNARTAQTMADNIDLDVSGVMDDTETLDDAAERLFDEVLAVASGTTDRRRTARPPRVRDPPPQSDDLSGCRWLPMPARRSRDARQAATPPAPRRVGRYPLDDLRAAVLRRHDQLHRSPGDRHPQADAAGASSAGARSTTPTSCSRSSSPTRSASCCAGRLMDRLGTKRGFALAIVVWSLAAMAHAEATAFGAAGRGAARRSSASTYIGVGRRVHRRAVRARPRRGGQLPGGDQDGGRVVPASASARSRRASSTRARTSARWSRRWSCRGSPSPAAGTGRSSPPARSASSGWRCGGCSTTSPSGIRASRRGRAGVHPQRSAGADRPRAVAHAAAASPDLGVRDRKVPDRSDLVALPVLDSRISSTGTTASILADRPAAGRRSISSPTSAASAAAGCRRR